MRQKKVKALRKKLGLKLPVKADYRQGVKVKKTVKINGKVMEVERVQVINAAKYQYRRVKKIFKGMR